MPQTVKAFGDMLGDSIDVTMYAPGGTGFVNHHIDPNVYQLFRQGLWDIIVLQPGSNESPAFSFPIDSTIVWGEMLVDSARAYNKCAKIFLYEISYGVMSPTPPSTSNYFFAQSRIKMNMLRLADSLNVCIAPGGEVMRSIWTEDSSFLLWGSYGDIHPNAYGSYAIASAFAGILFKKHISGLPFYSGLDSNKCKLYQHIADSIVFTSSIEWGTGVYSPDAAFHYTVSGGNSVQFNVAPSVYDSLRWYFGDGAESILPNPLKTYASGHQYHVRLVTYANGCADTYDTLVAISNFISNEITDFASLSGCLIYPNPIIGSSMVTVYLPSDKLLLNKVRCIIYDMTGRELIQSSLINGENFIMLEGISKGFYMVNILYESGETLGFKKLIIQ